MKTLNLKTPTIMFKRILLIFSVFLFGCADDENIIQAQVDQVQETVVTSDSTKKKIKIALLLDTSGSMDGLIEQAKSQLWTRKQKTH